MTCRPSWLQRVYSEHCVAVSSRRSHAPLGLAPISSERCRSHRLRQIMGGLVRQVELMSDRIDRNGLEDRLMAQPTPEQQALQRDIAEELARVVERLNALKRTLDRD